MKKCHVCGGTLSPLVTDMPFKTDVNRIVIVKDLPVLQCGACREYLIADSAMGRVEAVLAKASQHAELEVVRYAA